MSLSNLMEFEKEVIYNGRRYVSKAGSYMAYYCKECDYMVGCHGNTRRPLGTMIGKEMRGLRKAVHNKIDPLWQSGRVSRKRVYAFISRKLGINYHTGETNEETCRKVLALDFSEITH